MKLDFIDVRRAYFNAKARRLVYVDLCEEDKAEGDFEEAARSTAWLHFCTHGHAARAWDAAALAEDEGSMCCACCTVRFVQGPIIPPYVVRDGEVVWRTGVSQS